MRRGMRWLEGLALSLASLAVCAALLEAGARLWVEPAEPTGARFVVALPAAAAV